MDELLAAVIQLYWATSTYFKILHIALHLQIKLLTNLWNILYDGIGIKFYKGNKLKNKLFSQSNKSLADVITAYFLTFQRIVYILMQNWI